MSDMQPYHTRSPVLFIVFNRPDTTATVFEQIKIARPPRLYVAADGPREGRNENLRCEQTRQIVNEVDWDCEVKTLFQEKNLGCRDGEVTAMDWFFENEEEGIIVEDDCLPDNSFFKFCDELLEKYRFDTKVDHIAGGNFQHGKKWGDGSYYFSNLPHTWGWAGWRRVWKGYDKTLSKYNEDDASRILNATFNDPEITSEWVRIFREVKTREIDTWDYQYSFMLFFKGGVGIIPNVNLISNIGFGNNPTNTLNAESTWSKIPLGKIEEIVHPTDLTVQLEADIATLKEETDLTPKPGFIEKTLKRWRKSINKRLNK